MSVLREIKGLVLRGLRSETDDVKRATIDVFNAIDADLDSVDYNPVESDEDSAKDVIEAVATLNKALIELGEGNDPELKPTIGELSSRDLSDNEDDDKQ